MKVSFIIFILSTIGYISCSINIIDISLSDEYVVNTDDTTLYPDGIIPKDTTFYFRLGDIGEINKFLQIRTLSESQDLFIVKVGYFSESPHESEVVDTDLETLILKKNIYDGVDNLFLYYLEPLENSQYILISITLKSDLDYLRVYIKNDEEMEILQYDMKYYTDLELPVKQYQDRKIIFALNLTEDNIGDTSINLVVNHTDKNIEFYLRVIGLKTGKAEELNEEMVKDNPNFLDISLNETIKGVNDIYKYYLKLDENSKYIYVFIQIPEKLDNLKVYLTFPQKPFPRYNVTNSKEYEIDLKYLIKNRYNSIQIKSTNYHIGDTFIKLKVKKGVSKDYFYIGGFGEEEFIERDQRSPSVSTTIVPEFSKTFHKNKYDIHQYYFKAERKTAFYALNILLIEKTEYDYLSFKVDYTSEKDEDEDEDDDDNSTVLVVIIVIICALICLAITYFILRKFGIFGKNDISSKDIESSNQIMPNA